MEIAGMNAYTARQTATALFTREKLMDWKIFLAIFGTVFLAELGDKTQLATMLFAADKEVSKYTVFIAASAALVVASAIGVLAGSLLAEYINTKYLQYIAGVGFIGIGIFTLYTA
jgi:putative Ca2+/H+ antiporter (TMEM165/GDT1 family)